MEKISVVPCNQFAPGRALPHGVCERCGHQHGPGYAAGAQAPLVVAYLAENPPPPTAAAPLGIQIPRPELEVQNDVLREQADYYYGLLLRIGALFGDAAKIQADGTKMPGIIVAKVPELVENLIAIKGYKGARLPWPPPMAPAPDSSKVTGHIISSITVNPTIIPLPLYNTEQDAAEAEPEKE
jgi:hypothetical protein